MFPSDEHNPMLGSHETAYIKDKENIALKIYHNLKLNNSEILSNLEIKLLTF